MTAGPSADHWHRLEALLAEALERAPAEREAFLDGACAHDAGLRAELASLLAAHERSGAVDRLAADLAPLGAQVRGTAAPLTGQSIGPYEVLEPIGGGGMGMVYKAIDTRLGRTVALKFLRPDLDAHDSAAERFRLEARTVAALEHPNICTVHDIGEADNGQLYLAMPLYEGETLQQRIARGPLPLDQAVSIGVQVARGLAKAHSRGIVHRDIKPANVLVTDDGVAKILDFGIAKLVGVALTGPKDVLGTFSYMSPEQAQGTPVDHRTDLWSLGVVLYEMLAGRRPFLGAHPPAVSDAIRRMTPAPLSTHRSGVPPALAQIVMAALAKRPRDRYQTAQEMERDLLALGLATDLPGGFTPVPGTARAVRTEPATRARRLVGGAVAALLVGALVGAAYLESGARARSGAGGSTGGAATRVTPATIAVLPFADRSPGHDQAPFSDGITEELIATLTRVQGLRVASRTSVFALKEGHEDVRTVGARLGVGSVLEGSVRREGDRLRITAQLVNVADGYELWSEIYDGDAGDAFAVQEEIARAIAQTLRTRLVGAVGAGGAGPDSAAYDFYLKGRHALYLKGRYAWYGRTEQSLRAAAGYFEQAVRQAPDYARAHAGLADAYAVLGFYDYLKPAEAFPRAEAAARRAAELDPGLGGPHATLGYAALYYHYDLARGEQEFRQAIDLEPNYSTAHQWYANLLTAAGRFPEAVNEMQRAQEIDPLSLIAKAAQGWVLYHAGDYPGALAQCRQTLELDADYAVALLWSGWTLEAMDSLPAAMATLRHAVAASDSGGIYVASLARALALGGRRAEAEALLRRLQARGDSGRYLPSYEIAKAYDALGRPDRTSAWLERALAERSHSLVFLRVDPQLARFRRDPRFDALARRVRGD